MCVFFLKRLFSQVITQRVRCTVSLLLHDLGAEYPGPKKVNNSIWLGIYIHICFFIHIYIYMSRCIYVYVCISVYMYIYIYVYVYIEIHKYTNRLTKGYLMFALVASGSSPAEPNTSQRPRPSYLKPPKPSAPNPKLDPKNLKLNLNPKP